MRLRLVAATAAAAAGVAFSTFVGSVCGCATPTFPDGGGGDPGTANVWVDTNGGTCSRSATPGDYADATACGDFQSAYEVASLGDSVGVAPGTYPTQTMNYISGKGDASNEPDVTFRAEGTVDVSNIAAYGLRHATFSGLQMTGPLILYCQDSGLPDPVASGENPVDVTFDNGSMSYFRSENANSFTVSNSDIGPSSSVIKVGASSDTGGANCTDNAPSNQVIEANTIHNFREASPASHMECIFVEGVNGLAIRRNRISGCSVFDIFFKQQLSAGEFGMDDITVENNMLGHPVASAFRSADSSSISFSVGTYSGLTVRHNSINGTLLLRTDLATTWSSAVIDGNLSVSRGGDCAASGVTWVGNAWSSTGQSCPGDVADGVTTGWLDVETSPEINSSTSDPTIDFHIPDGAWAIDKAIGTPPATDFDGDSRPDGAASDIGADER